MKDKMKTCAVCGKEFASSAKACPECGAKNKRPIYLRPWFVALLIVVVVFCGLKFKSASKNFTIDVNKSGVNSSIKAAELIEIANTDELKFKEEYVGARVTFTAQISKTEGHTYRPQILKSYASGLVFNVSGGNYITVCLNNESIYREGDTVTVTGEIDTEQYGNVYIDASSSNIIS